MPDLMSHDEFLSTHFERACKIADITISSTLKTNGPIDAAIDIESVKMEGVLAGLERTFENFDARHESKAKVTTLLNTIVHNCVLTELGKATTEARRAGLISPKPKKNKENADHIIIGAKSCTSISGPVEAHQYIEYEGWQERKETVFKLIGKYMMRLPVNDQVILTHWAEEEKTYVEKSLEELGLEYTPAIANWVYGRKNKALKALRTMMGGQKPEYRDIYLPSAGRNTNRSVYSDRNALRRHQYAAKSLVTRNIDYKDTATKLAEKLYQYPFR